MDNLLSVLREIDASSRPDNADLVLQVSDDDVHRATLLANRVLMDDEGRARFDIMDILWRQHGFFVIPGERNARGYITGGIQTKKGVIVFG
jgi:hypothetical protein